MADFQHHESFQPGELSGEMRLGKYEVFYKQMFEEAMADGVITAEERQELSKAAEKFGLDPGRLAALEKALEEAHHAHHGVRVLDITRAFGTAPVSIRPVQLPSPKAVLAQPEGEPSAEMVELKRRIEFLEKRVAELQKQLEVALSHVSMEVNFSDLEAPVPSSRLDEPSALHRRLSYQPRDTDLLHALFEAHQGNGDRQFCVAQALVYLNAADEHEKAHYEAHCSSRLMTPKSALVATDWQRLLTHPEDEAQTSELLGIVVSAVLLAHSTVMRSKGMLPELDPARRLEPTKSTVMAAQCFSWAAQTLGMSAPILYAAPEQERIAQLVATVPPVCQLGQTMLTERTPNELAFLVGQQLAYYRRDRFIRLLVPNLVDLEDLFLAALMVANPKLPIKPNIQARVQPLANALSPLLESTEIDRLRGAYLRFVEQGGRTNLGRWARAADLTAMRVGFLMCGDLKVAEEMLKLQSLPNFDECMDDLLVFVTGDRYGKLRDRLGIAIGG